VCIPYNLEHTTPKRIAEHAREIQHTTNCHSVRIVGMNHPRTLMAAARRVAAEKQKATAKGIGSPSDETEGICIMRNEQ
jgi:hypothetical protein